MPKLKPLATPALIFLLLIAAAQSASAADWVEITDDNEGWLYFIDRDSVQTKSYSSMVAAWVMTLYPNESYDKDLLEFDFSDRTYRLLASYQYDSNGRITESYTNPSSWNHIIPGTIGEEIYLYLKDYLNW